jgi:hypothetical protein
MGNPGMSLLERPRKWLHEWSTRRKNQRTIDTLDAVLAGRDPILLVHQMGRAGSMTTVNTLRGAGLDLAVFHTHWLNPASVERRQHWVAHLPETRQPLNIRMSARISAQLQQEATGQRQWKLVTVFREPIARNVSVFFLSIDAFVENFQERHQRGELDNETLMEIFLEKFPHEQPLLWFEQEVKDVFGIDVYDQAFPQDQGYQVIRHDHVDLLLIKLEQLNNCYRKAFPELLEVEIPNLKHTHVTELDPSKPMYTDFVRNASFPPEYLDRMYESAFARHFYTDAERDAFRRKWSTAWK